MNGGAPPLLALTLRIGRCMRQWFKSLHFTETKCRPLEAGSVLL